MPCRHRLSAKSSAGWQVQGQGRRKDWALSRFSPRGPLGQRGDRWHDGGVEGGDGGVHALGTGLRPCSLLEPRPAPSPCRKFIRTLRMRQPLNPGPGGGASVAFPGDSPGMRSPPESLVMLGSEVKWILGRIIGRFQCGPRTWFIKAMLSGFKVQGLGFRFAGAGRDRRGQQGGRWGGGGTETTPGPPQTLTARSNPKEMISDSWGKWHRNRRNLKCFLQSEIENVRVWWILRVGCRQQGY